MDQIASTSHFFKVEILDFWIIPEAVVVSWKQLDFSLFLRLKLGASGRIMEVTYLRKNGFRGVLGNLHFYGG